MKKEQHKNGNKGKNMGQLTKINTQTFWDQLLFRHLAKVFNFCNLYQPFLLQLFPILFQTDPTHLPNHLFYLPLQF